jgi:hypothetical protein
LTTIYIPDGDGYEDITFLSTTNTTWSVDGTGINLTGTGTVIEKNVTVGTLIYTIKSTPLGSGAGANIGDNTTTVYLTNPQTGSKITEPALVIFEEKDDNTAYHALVVTVEDGATSDDGIGVSDVVRTWEKDGVWDSIAMYSDSTQTKEADLWGTIIKIDSSASDQKTAVISYPDEQVYAQIFMAEEAAAITAGTTGTSTVSQLGEIVYTDKEIDQAKTKNIIAVGGSCINSVAAKALGSDTPICGAAFTENTKVGSGQFLIKSVGDVYTTGKIVLVVAGYDAADTINAAKYLRTKVVDTTAGKTYIGTTNTEATLQVA